MTIYAGYGRFEPMSVELDKIVELQAENAKLRAALEEIKRLMESTDGTYHAYQTACRALVER